MKYLQACLETQIPLGSCGEEVSCPHHSPPCTKPLRTQRGRKDPNRRL